MKTALGALVLPDHLTTALENRAYREGLLKLDDYGLAEIQRPEAGPPTVDEDAALDALFLYDMLLTDSRRFNLQPINAVADTPVLAQRPSHRALRFDRLQFVEGPPRSLMDLLRQVRGVRRGTIPAEQVDQIWLTIEDEASMEARVLIERDLPWYLEDARRNFEGDERGLEPDPFTRDEVTHAAGAAFLRRNMFWMVEHLDGWHVDGLSHHDQFSSDLWDVPKVVQRPLEVLSRSLRFESYWRFLQDTYRSLFEAAFLGRILDVETGYGRAPLGPPSSENPLRGVAATQLIRVRLSDVAEFFPLPRCVEEAMEMRAHPKAIAFREVLDRWLEGVATGDKLESRLREEIDRASRDLRGLGRWKSLKSNPMFFGVKTAVSLVPVVGQATTLVDVIDYFVERRVASRTAWFVSPRNRLD